MSVRPLHERLGIDPASEIALEARLTSLARPPAPGADPWVAKANRVMLRQQAVLACYLTERLDDVRRHAAELVREVEDYLLDDWVETATVTRWVDDPGHPDGGFGRSFVAWRAWWRRELHWMECFRDGLLWALWLGDREAARRLCAYPGDDVPDRVFDRGPAEKAWRVLAASLLLGEPPEARAESEGVMKAARAKAPKFLLAAVRSIEAADAGALRRALLDLLKLHKQKVFPEPGLDNKLALDASLIALTARSRDLAIQVESFGVYTDFLIVP